MTKQPASKSRVDPPFVADERTMLLSWLDYHRETLLWKCEDLTDEQLKTAATPPSNLTLLGLVRHMTEVERSWFRQVLDGQQVPEVYCTENQPDADFENLDDTDVPTVFECLRTEIEDCKAVAVEYESLDHIAHARDDISLRWIFNHMIEEYARHNGHADLLREAIDGSTED